MARSTRSTTQVEEKEKDTQEPAASTSTQRSKTTAKKRKRHSITDSDGQPANKQLRSDSNIKEEGEDEPGEPDNDVVLRKPELQNAGDVPIDPDDAQKILEVLEMIDTQGLLDRVFPLQLTEVSTAVSPSQSRSYSFRTLLQESSVHPLRVLRSAVRHLVPISSHPRSRPSVPAAEQSRFCEIALSLLDQASFNSRHIPLEVESLFPTPEAAEDGQEKTESDETKPTGDAIPISSVKPQSRKRRYALVQHLPTGDWWTSLNSESLSPLSDDHNIKDLPTGYAELVAVLNSPVASTSTSQRLGSYATKKNVELKAKLPGPRRVTCGAFLDYGPYSSFAPTFSQDGREIGHRAMGEVIWMRRERTKHKPFTLRDIIDLEDVDMEQPLNEAGQSLQPGEGRENELGDGAEDLDQILPPDQAASFKAALDDLGLENAVQELLDRNARALRRLEELQIQRVLQESSDRAPVEVRSEEYETAKGILDSLVVLASLRPRPSGVSDHPALVPPLPLLRKLHRTLPTSASPGWFGTLPTSKPTALRDDSTLRVKAGVTVPATPAPTNPQAQPATPVPTTTPSYSGYAYPNYASQYRPAQYTQYKPGQTPSYYPNAYANQAQPQNTAQAGTTYYAGQQYGTSGQQYTYGTGASWYNYQPGAAAAAGASNSGRGTPQPTPATPVIASYPSYYGTQQPQASRAVANTVASTNKTYPHNTPWTGPTAATPSTLAPTLPANIRTAVPGTPGAQPATPTAGTYQQTNYYGVYPAPPAAARSD